MKLFSNSFADGERIPERYAFGKHANEGHVALSDNLNPHFQWSDLPGRTESLVLICHDPDVPSKVDDVNQEGKVVPASLPRLDFYHWILMDLPAGASPIQEGEFSSKVTVRGKEASDVPRGLRQGINDYTSFFASDTDMAGTYYGYDGPCPPWNDEIIHHYHFTLYAIDVSRCPAKGEVRGADVLKAIEPHVLAQASLMGTYAVNPSAK